MKHHILLTLLLAATTASAQDYSKMSRSLCRVIQQNTAAMRGKSFTGNNSKMHVFVKGDEADVAPYCVRHQGDIHIAHVPINQIATLSEKKGIRYIEANTTRHKTLMDHTLRAINADKVQNGNNLPQAFTGKGVLAGNVDVAHDYSHPTFRSTTDCHLRIVRAWDWFNNPADMTEFHPGNFPLGTLYTDTTAIYKAMRSLDSANEFHGTHTASITAGSGWGSPYKGVAPEADIYLTTIMMSNNGKYLNEELLQSITSATVTLAYQNIFDYADSIGKPCVINYSAGGPQDITDADALQNEYFSSMTGPGKIIVAAAGNSGILEHNKLTINAQRKQSGGQMICTYGDYQQLSVRTRGGKIMLTIMDMEADDPYNTSTPIILDCTEKDGQLTSESRLTPYEFSIIQDDRLLDGMEIQIYPGYDGFDHRFIGYDIYLYKGTKELTCNKYAVMIESEDGSEAELIASDANIMPMDIDFPSSDTDPTLHLNGGERGGTILTPASLPSVIAVGATSWRNTYTTIYGEHKGNFTNEPGTRVKFSSVGPTLHGLTKPDVMAPGTYIVAAYNSFDEEEASDPFKICAAETTLGDRTYRYYNSCGTSMSAPVVSGVIALWLQADPTLTRERIMDIIAKTSHQPDASLTYPNNEYGYGEIDAYAGLLEVLGLTAIEGISKQHMTNATVRPTADGAISITLDEPCDNPMPCRIYYANGTIAKSTMIPAATYNVTIPMTDAKGIMIVQIDGCGSTMLRME